MLPAVRASSGRRIVGFVAGERRQLADRLANADVVDRIDSCGESPEPNHDNNLLHELG